MKKTQRLLNKSTSQEIATNVRVADSMFTRAKGLLGEKSLPEDETLFIQGSIIPCNSIHTWFMRFPIDVVFVDKSLVVKAVYKNLGPWRMTPPVLGAHSVFEFAAGALSNKTVSIGDQLYVGD